MSWTVISYRDTADVHVLPVNDTRAHDELRQCWCRPSLDDESLHVVVVHHSMDWREYFEPDHTDDPKLERPS